MIGLTKWFIKSKSAVPRLCWFTSQFELQSYTGIDKMFYLFFEYCSELGVTAKKKYLEAFLKTDGKKVVKKHNIKLETMDNYDYSDPAALEEAFRVISNIVIQKYDDAVEHGSGDEDEGSESFKVEMRTFMEEQKQKCIQNVIATIFPKLSNGGDTDELLGEMQRELSNIETQYNVDALDELDFLTGNTEVAHRVEQMRFLFKTGMPAVDGDSGGVYSKQVVSLSSQPGAGKTRYMCAHYVYPAAVRYKLGVLVDEQEMTRMEIVNMLIAHHIVHLYGGKVKIPDSLINKGELSTEQMRYVEAARIDLFESGKYGRILIRDKGLICETLEKEMTNFLKYNRDIQVWFNDYVGLTQSKPQDVYTRRLDEPEIIKETYKISKRIAKRCDIGVMLINQFNEKGVEAARAGKKIQSNHIQGGQIVQRHSDYDLAMCMTDEQEIAGLRTLQNPKKRGAAGFGNVLLKTDLAVSIFVQQKQ